MSKYLTGAVMFLAAGLWGAAQDKKPTPMSPDPQGPNPIAAHPTLFIEEMTWMEVRDALKSGKDTALVATGGVEQNGPYLATGKHNVILRATTQAIADEVGMQLKQMGELPAHYALDHSSMDCYDCTAFADHSLDRVRYMRENHPILFFDYRDKLERLSAAIQEPFSHYQRIRREAA